MPKEIPSSFFSGSSPIALVAGGAGFIGSFVCEALLEKGVKVVCVDNWQTGLKENIKKIQDDKNFLLFEANINKRLPKSLSRLDYIIHLSGMESYLNGEDVSIETLEANSVGTKNLLNLAEKTDARFLLASTVYVYLAQMSGKSLKGYFGNTKEQETQFTHTEAKRFAEALTYEYGLKKNVDVRIVRLCDVYGPRMGLTTNSLMSKFIRQAVYRSNLKESDNYKESLEVPGQGEGYFYPLYIDDVVSGITKALFSAGTKNKIYSLAGEKTGVLQVAEEIKGLSGNLEIILNPELMAKDEGVLGNEQTGDIVRDSLTLPGWQQKVSLEEGLKQTIEWFKTAYQSKTPTSLPVVEKSLWEPKQIKLEQKPEPIFRTVEVTTEKTEKRTTYQTKKIHKAFLALSLLFTIILSWYFLLPFVQFAIGAAELGLAKKALLATDSSKASTWSTGSEMWFKMAESSFSKWHIVPGLKNESVKLSSKSNLLAQTALVGKTASSVVSSGKIFVEGVSGDSSFSSKQSADDLSIHLKTLEQQTAFLDAAMGNNDLTLSIPLLSKKTLLTKEELQSLRKVSSGMTTLLPYAPELLGEKGKKVYLVLFQNNAELRPTGGFIGSYALVSFENGRMSNFEVQDVYTADGQLKGHVDPPGPIREYLGEANWYLRDSNWSPDFPTSAARAAWFLDKEIGQKVNGVIALDLDFAKELVGGLGEINIADFNQKVNKDNLYEVTQAKAEKDFFPGSHAKKDFLTALSKTLLGMIVEDPGKHLGAFGRATVLSLEGRHLSFWTDNLSVNKALASSGWDGGLKKFTCPASKEDTTCTADYLQIVEANLGVNKSNFFLERDYSMDISLSEDKSTHRLTISYKNNSTKGVWPGGDYKNYFRAFVPEGSKLTLAALVEPLSGKQENLTTDESVEKDKVVYGALATVPAGERRDVVLMWETPIKQTIEKGNYMFYWQKQAGVLQDRAFVRFVLPGKGLSLKAYPTPSLTDSSSVSYNTTLSKDLLINLVWDKSKGTE